ncbi:hypothetical protein ACOMCU_16095 [Lysinibacillus sp. UGB7]|uniref:hypothetical protein n=1 Tax=Lysinibacillus sp. UGB7 TaxID=3411039 RepID=UPI003B7D852D
MKTLATIKTTNKEDTLKYAFAFMQTESLKIKECTFMNPNPQEFDSKYILPRDSYSVTYNDGVPSWEIFKKNPVHLSSPGFMCVASLDPKDTQRVNLSALNGVILFNCYGNYENEAKKAFKNITSIYETLT